MHYHFYKRLYIKTYIILNKIQVSIYHYNLTSPQPISLYFESILRLKAIFYPVVAYTGLFSDIVTISSITCYTFPSHYEDFTFILNFSPSFIFSTFIFYSVDFNKFVNLLNLNVIYVSKSGILPTLPRILPTILLFLVKLGSTTSPTPINPPGTA